MIKRISIIISLILTFFQVIGQIDQSKIGSLEQYYQKALIDWNVPGMAIAIVTNDSVLFSKGFGVSDIENRKSVDDNTLFALASNTKAFTATALAMLVDEGKIKWDDKVTNYLPWFKLYDPFVTESFTIRDLLCHRSGLETFSGDLLWNGSTFSRTEVVRKAQYLKPKYGFREHFGYSNIMLIAAGEIIPVVTGISWDDFVANRILKPLKMNRSVLHVSALPKIDNVAAPHVYVKGQLQKIPWLDWDNMGPAGALISSAHDMAKWLQFNLNQGIAGQDTLLNPKRIFELQSPNTLIQISEVSRANIPSTHFKAYGMGWSLMDYLGRKIVSHNGGYDGMISQTVLIPEENIGFVIITNSLSSLYYPLMYKTLDVLLNNPEQKDWSKQVLHMVKAGEEASNKKRIEQEENRNKKSKPSLPIDSYTGYYGCELYDSVKVYKENDQLFVQYAHTPGLLGELNHYQYDTYTIEFKAFPSLPKGFATFKINRDANVEELEIFVDNPDFDFTEFKLKKFD